LNHFDELVSIDSTGGRGSYLNGWSASRPDAAKRVNKTIQGWFLPASATDGSGNDYAHGRFLENKFPTASTLFNHVVMRDVEAQTKHGKALAIVLFRQLAAN
jgi:hypothetical protein